MQAFFKNQTSCGTSYFFNNNMKFKYAKLDFTPKEINKEQKTLRAVFSTGDVDRHGEVVDQKSWILDDFLKNPVVLFGHDHSQPPVGKIVGLGYNEDGNLEGEVKFAADEYPFANVIWNLYREGFMKAFSVGFAAGKVDIIDGQVVLKDNTLFEISTVSVPANAFALAKAKGIDTSSLETVIAEQAKAEQTAKKKCADCDAEIEFEKDCPCKAPKAEEVVEETPAEETLAEVVETPAEVVETPEVVEETPAPVLAAEEDEAEVEKSISDIISEVKEGRVLSKKNRKVLEDALVAIQAVLEADAPKDSKSIESDRIANFVKVAVPAVSIKTHNKNRAINKAIRELLKQKRQS